MKLVLKSRPKRSTATSSRNIRRCSSPLHEHSLTAWKRVVCFTNTRWMHFNLNEKGCLFIATGTSARADDHDGSAETIEGANMGHSSTASLGIRNLPFPELESRGEQGSPWIQLSISWKRKKNTTVFFHSLIRTSRILNSETKIPNVLVARVARENTFWYFSSRVIAIERFRSIFTRKIKHQCNNAIRNATFTVCCNVEPCNAK